MFRAWCAFALSYDRREFFLKQKQSLAGEL